MREPKTRRHGHSVLDFPEVSGVEVDAGPETTPRRDRKNGRLLCKILQELKVNKDYDDRT